MLVEVARWPRGARVRHSRNCGDRIPTAVKPGRPASTPRPTGGRDQHGSLLPARSLSFAPTVFSPREQRPRMLAWHAAGRARPGLHTLRGTLLVLLLATCGGATRISTRVCGSCALCVCNRASSNTCSLASPLLRCAQAGVHQVLPARRRPARPKHREPRVTPLETLSRLAHEAATAPSLLETAAKPQGSSDAAKRMPG